MSGGRPVSALPFSSSSASARADRRHPIVYSARGLVCLPVSAGFIGLKPAGALPEIELGVAPFASRLMGLFVGPSI